MACQCIKGPVVWVISLIDYYPLFSFFSSVYHIRSKWTPTSSGCWHLPSVGVNMKKSPYCQENLIIKLIWFISSSVRLFFCQTTKEPVFIPVTVCRAGWLQAPLSTSQFRFSRGGVMTLSPGILEFVAVVIFKKWHGLIFYCLIHVPYILLVNLNLISV